MSTTLSMSSRQLEPSMCSVSQNQSVYLPAARPGSSGGSRSWSPAEPSGSNQMNSDSLRIAVS